MPQVLFGLGGDTGQVGHGVDCGQTRALLREGRWDTGGPWWDGISVAAGGQIGGRAARQLALLRVQGSQPVSHSTWAAEQLGSFLLLLLPFFTCLMYVHASVHRCACVRV